MFLRDSECHIFICTLARAYIFLKDAQALLNPRLIATVPLPTLSAFGIVRRLSQEKQKWNFKSRSDEKEVKRRLQIARDLKYESKLCRGDDEAVEQCRVEEQPPSSREK